MRGKDLYSVPFRDELRITPAYAGKSHIRSSLNAVSGDHPRVCGEKPLQSSVNCTMEGSPPRMRGKAVCGEVIGFAMGITPACAGKRRRPPDTSPARWDHPRVCGEKHAVPVSLMWSAGSPPRVRGKASCILVSSSTVGITPAYAGKSARRQAGPPGPAPPPQMRLGWSPPPCTGRQCRTRKSTHARRARIPVPAHTPAPQ